MVTLSLSTYGSKWGDLNSRLSDKLDRSLKINDEIIDQLSIHGCIKCIAIIQKVIKDNQNPGVETPGHPSGQTDENTRNVDYSSI